MSKTPVELLANEAAAFGVTIRKRTGSGLEVDLPVPLPDGTSPIYELSLIASGPEVTVRERTPARLPSFCPERHINPGGSFCLGWHEAEDLRVTDEQSAERLLGKVVKFLRSQERVRRARRWPSSRTWAHGGAAKHQHAAIRAATALDPYLADAAQRGKLKVRRRGTGVLGPALEVHLGSKHLFSVWEKDRRLVNLKRRCFASTPHKRPGIIKKCKDHHAAAVALAFALRDWDAAEAAFWKSLRGTPCCGTLDQCPLK